MCSTSGNEDVSLSSTGCLSSSQESVISAEMMGVKVYQKERRQRGKKGKNYFEPMTSHFVASHSYRKATIMAETLKFSTRQKTTHDFCLFAFFSSLEFWTRCIFCV